MRESYSRHKENEQTSAVVSEAENNEQPVKSTQSTEVSSTRKTRSSTKKNDSADADESVYGTPTKIEEDSQNLPEEEEVVIPPAPKSKNVRNKF